MDRKGDTETGRQGDTENLKTHLIEDTPSAGVTLRWSTESTKETRKTK
ncbi:hypothetical protein ES705_07974 [subsurface metagenome]